MSWFCSVSIAAVNVVGAVGEPVVVLFIVDRVPPAVTVALTGEGLGPIPADSVVSVRGLSAAVDVFDELSVSTAAVVGQWRLNGVPVADGPLVMAQSGTLTAHTWMSSLLATSDGLYRFEARATDGAGNPGTLIAASVSVDTFAPALLLSNSVPGLGRPPYDKEPNVAVEVEVQDAFPASCVLLGVPAIAGLSSFNLSFVSQLGGDRALFRGVAGVGGFQGNITVTVTGQDGAVPPNDATPVSFWVVHDSFPPVHSVALASGPSLCVVSSGVTVCRAVQGAVFDVACASSDEAVVGGATAGATQAPCHVEWAVGVLSGGLCGAAQGRNNAVSAISEFAALPVGAPVLNSTGPAESLWLEADGQRAAVSMVLISLARDAAGNEGAEVSTQFWVDAVAPAAVLLSLAPEPFTTRTVAGPFCAVCELSARWRAAGLVVAGAYSPRGSFEESLFVWWVGWGGVG